MKFIVMAAAIGFAVFVGFNPKIHLRRPKISQWLVILSILITIVLSFYPPISGTTTDLKFISNVKPESKVNVSLKVIDINIQDGQTYLKSESKHGNSTDKISFAINDKDLNFTLGDEIVANLSYNHDTEQYSFNRLVAVNPIMTYPYVPALQERIRILSLHVPMAWVAVIAYLVSMIYSIIYIKKRNLNYDIHASSAALLGLVFTILATTTGMVWAKFNWGSYWNWDPRQTSILILMLVYAAYFALRSSIEREDLKALLGSVYSIIAFVTVPFLIFILPRLYSGLHPGAKDDGTTGPVISSTTGMLDSNLLYTYGIALFGFTALFFWMMNLHIRYKNIKLELGK